MLSDNKFKKKKAQLKKQNSKTTYQIQTNVLNMDWESILVEKQKFKELKKRKLVKRKVKFPVVKIKSVSTQNVVIKRKME